MALISKIRTKKKSDKKKKMILKSVKLANIKNKFHIKLSFLGKKKKKKKKNLWCGLFILPSYQS